MPRLFYKQDVIDFVDFINWKLWPEGILFDTGCLIANWHSGQEEFEIHTSGSTGNPKKIILQRDKIIYSAQLTAKAFGLSDKDILFCCLHVHSVAGFMMVMRALVLGCDLVITEASSSPLGNIQQRIDFAAFVPLQLEKMLEHNSTAFRDLNAMKAILVGGAPISDALMQRIRRIQAPVFQTYSMTETYTHVATRRLNGPFSSEAYTPLPEVQITQDERHCIVITSPITDNKPLQTNDIAEFFNDGTFYWLGRYDNIVNSGGIKIQIEWTEDKLRRVFAEKGITNNFFLTGIADPRLGQMLMMVIEGGKITPQEVDEWTKEILPPYHSPRAVYAVDKIIRTESGKIDRINTLKALSIDTIK